MNKMQKLTCARVLKIVFYLLGFPLLLLLVAKDSMVFFDESVFHGNANAGVLVVVILWIGFSLIQVGLYLVIKKQQALRTIILVVLAITLTLAPLASFDKANEKQISELQAKYSEKGVKVENYSLQKQWFNSLSDKKGYTDILNETIAEFIRVYGLNDYYADFFRGKTQVNTVPYVQTLDGTQYKVGTDGTNLGDIWDEHKYESPYLYNPNGLLYEGYIFGVQNALDQLIKYHEYSTVKVYRLKNPQPTNAAQAQGTYLKIEGNWVSYNKATHGTNYASLSFYELVSLSDAYAALITEQAIAENDASTAWGAYVSTEDYKSKKAIADNYVITEQRLNDVLSTVFKYIGESAGLNDLISGLNLNSILKLVSSLLAENTADLNSGDIGNTITQLLYGYNNGHGGTTTGLALPAQYLFQNINLSGSTMKSQKGFINTVSGGTISSADAVANGYSVFAGVYIAPEVPGDDPVFTLSYEKYDPSIHTVGEFDPNVLDTKVFNGAFYNEEDLGVYYATYKANLESSYPTTPSTAALVDIIKSLQPALGLVGGLLDIGSLIGGLIPIQGLDINKLFVEGGLDSVVNTLLSSIDLSGISVEGVQNLLNGLLGEISYYQHPELKLCWDAEFINASDKALETTDGKFVDLSDYAANKYTCEQAGIASGTVLISTGGLLAGKTLGNGASPDDAFSLAELYKLQADLEYMDTMYPRLSARRYMSMWAGILAVSIYFTAYFYKKEQKLFYEITLEGGEF